MFKRLTRGNIFDWNAHCGSNGLPARGDAFRPRQSGDAAKPRAIRNDRLHERTAREQVVTRYSTHVREVANAVPLSCERLEPNGKALA